MPAYGELLSPEEIDDVAEFVLSLSGADHESAAAERGAETYEIQCLACHDEGGVGMAELGAPNLSDQIWLYGGDKDSLVAQIAWPKQGVMPGWQDRLDESTIKMLSVYVHTLGGGQ